MRLLPAPLLLLIAVCVEAQDARLPTAIRKMAPDQAEKFLHEYAAFPSLENVPSSPLLFTDALAAPPFVARRDDLISDSDAHRLAANASAELAYRPPWAPHLEWETDKEAGVSRRETDGDIVRRAALAKASLQGRQWACPAGTNSCAAIGFPNSCCSTSETCVQITDTGLGSVGCCPSGSSCGGSITNCAAGNTPCASNIGGGCCIPGFVCQGVGCVPAGPAIVTVTTTSITVVSNAQGPSTVLATVIVTITPTDSGAITTLTTTQYTTLPASTETVTSSPGTSLLPPVRLTSTSQPDTSTGSSDGFCPTGFYPCLASAGGGCCQTGRDCQTTSCPPIAYTTVINTDGVTVVVPATAVPTPTTTDHCADSWFLCGKDAGPRAGCCPSGYECGTASCFLGTGAGGPTASVAKELPNRADRSHAGEWLGAVTFIMAGLMLA